MRGLAALMVVFRHTTVFGTAPADSHSYLAVDLFFVLSGFVVAHAYERPLLEHTMGFGRFVAVRLIRLYPLLLVSVAFAAAVALTAPPYDAASASPWDPVSPGAGSILGGSTLALLFLPSQVGGSPLLFPLNTALWSLMYELAINVLYAAWGVRLSTRAFAAVVVACGLAVAAFALHREGLDWGWSWGVGSLVPGLLRAGFGFGAGVLLRRGPLQGWPCRRFRCSRSRCSRCSCPTCRSATAGSTSWRWGSSSRRRSCWVRARRRRHACARCSC
jgi:peptidoglycan/LPS O-acetylase OafA/YrhL